MSRKHFRKFALMLRSIGDPAERANMALNIANVCAECNPRFDCEKFYEAADVDSAWLRYAELI